MNTLFLSNIAIVFYVSFLLILWFLSDIVDTFAKITKTQKILKIEEFKSYKLNTNIMANYPDFLYEVYPGWTTKLLSCPICLCFWSTLISVNLLIPIEYRIFVFPVNYVCSLFLYLLIRKLL